MMKAATPILLLLFLTACSPLKPRQPPPALHDFGPLPAATAHGGNSVVVTAPPWLQDTRLRYRLLFRDPTRVRFYAGHRWIAPPPALLAQRLASIPAQAPDRIHVHLLDCEQIFDTPTHSRIVLRFLVEASLGDGQVTARRSFTVDHPTPSATVQGALATYAEVVAQAVGKMHAWLKDLPQRPPIGTRP